MTFRTLFITGLCVLAWLILSPIITLALAILNMVLK